LCRQTVEQQSNPALAIASTVSQVEKMNVLADKGYHTGDQIQQCIDNNITTFVSPKEPSTKDIGLYPISMFTYDNGGTHIPT
jgi:hypothetical protein